MAKTRKHQKKVIESSADELSEEDQLFSDAEEEADQLEDDDIDELANDDEELSDELDDDVDEMDEEDEEPEDEEEQLPTPSRSKGRSKNKKRVLESESDEDDMMEVLRNKPMTKRQRAKMNREDDDELLELPMDTGKKQLRTQEEEALRRSEVARRRKNQSIQRAEKDKQDTINRLLKKQAGKSKKNEVSEADQPKHKRHHDPHAIRYVQCPQESTLNIPEKLTVDEVFGWQPWDNKRSPKPMETCDVQGCTNIKKYTAKSSGKAVCSLEHYKMVEAK